MAASLNRVSTRLYAPSHLPRIGKPSATDASCMPSGSPSCTLDQLCSGARFTCWQEVRCKCLRKPHIGKLSLPRQLTRIAMPSVRAGSLAAYPLAPDHANSNTLTGRRSKTNPQTLRAAAVCRSRKKSMQKAHLNELCTQQNVHVPPRSLPARI